MFKFRKIKGNRVLNAGIGYTVGNYFLKGINFLTIPLFTRIMTTGEYGIYSTYMTYDSILSIVIGFALHSSLKNAKYRYNEKFDSYVSSILLLPVFFLAFLYIILNIFPTPFTSLLDLNIVILNILLIQAFSGSILQIYNNKLGLDYNYKSFLKISFINTGLNLLFSLILMYTVFSGEKYIGRIIGAAFPLLLITVFVYFRSFQKSKPVFNKEYWKFGLGYSLPIIPHGLSQVVLSSFDKIMIRKIIGSSEAGIYSLGINIEGLVKVTTTSLDTVWGPWFYEKMAEKNYKSIKEYSTYYAYGMFVFVSCLMLAAPEIVQIMGSSAYHDAQYVVIPLMNCTYFTFLYNFPAVVEYYYQKTKIIAIGTMGAAVLNIILNSIFIRNFGYQAAAYTTLVSYVAYFTIHYLFAKKIAKMQFFNTKALVSFIIGIFAINIFSLYFIENFWVRLIIGLLFLIINVLIAYKFLYLKKFKNKNN